MNSHTEIYFAPLQGFTDYVYRNLYAETFDGVEKFFTPFLRVEGGEVRRKDAVDLEMTANRSITVPQIIANCSEDVDILAQLVLNKGFEHCDINFGCPFPQQTHKMRGAGILPHPDKVAEVLKAAAKYPELKFSVKMRLGNTDKTECLAIVDILNDAPLSFVTVHPRISKQMYSGMIDMAMFQELTSKINHPTVYNGDIATVDDIHRITSQFPNIKAVMIGRGLLANPFLAQDYKADGNCGFDVKTYMNFINNLLHGYLAQYDNSEYMALDKMKTFWAYPPLGVNKKHVKDIQKSRTISEFVMKVAVAVNKL